MKLTIKAPCGCACEVFVDGERQRIIRQTWCRTVANGSRVNVRDWRVNVRGGAS
jgi:hypothetical protein